MNKYTEALALLREWGDTPKIVSQEAVDFAIIADEALQIADRLEQADEKKMARRMICDTCSEAETCGQGELGDWCGEYGVLLKTVKMALADIRGDTE